MPAKTLYAFVVKPSTAGETTVTVGWPMGIDGEGVVDSKDDGGVSIPRIELLRKHPVLETTANPNIKRFLKLIHLTGYRSVKLAMY